MSRIERARKTDDIGGGVMTDLKVVSGGNRDTWWNAFTELESEIRDLRRMAELMVMVLEDSLRILRGQALAIGRNSCIAVDRHNQPPTFESDFCIKILACNNRSCTKAQ